MVNWMELIKEDINQEDGTILSILDNFTLFLFKGVILLGIPVFIYCLINFF